MGRLDNKKGHFEADTQSHRVSTGIKGRESSEKSEAGFCQLRQLCV